MSKFQDHKAEILASLYVMVCAEWDWEDLPPVIRELDRPSMEWIAAALASEGIGKVG